MRIEIVIMRMRINSKHETLNSKWFDELNIPSEAEGQIRNPKH